MMWTWPLFSSLSWLKPRRRPSRSYLDRKKSWSRVKHLTLIRNCVCIAASSLTSRIIDLECIWSLNSRNTWQGCSGSNYNNRKSEKGSSWETILSHLLSLLLIPLRQRRIWTGVKWIAILIKSWRRKSLKEKLLWWVCSETYSRKK